MAQLYFGISLDGKTRMGLCKGGRKVGRKDVRRVDLVDSTTFSNPDLGRNSEF